MPTYTITDPNSGRTLRVTGDSPPTEGELYKLFAVDGGPDTADEGFRASLKDTGTRTIKGVVRGAVSAANPINWVKGPIDLVKDLSSGGHGTADTLRAIASGDPDVGGEAIGALLTGGIAGRVVPPLARRTPNAMVKAGDVIAKGGRYSRRATPYGVAGAVFTGNPAGLAAAAAPYVIEGAGRTMSRAGRAMGGGQRPSVVAPISQRSPLPSRGARALSTGEEAGVQSLDRMLESIHGSDYQLPGNGRLPATVRPQSPQSAALFEELIEQAAQKARQEPTGLTRAGQSMLTANERSLFTNALEELRSGSLSRARSIVPRVMR